MRKISVLFLLCSASCASLQLTLHNASVQRPSNVALYFAVQTDDGAPVAGLKAESFRIYEDDQLISPFESKQTILNPEVAVESYTLLLLDLSGSVVESGALYNLVSAAAGFAQRVSKREKVGIYGFDGGSTLISLVPFTTSAAAITAGLARVSQHRPRDPSTNLNGAVVAAVGQLKQRLGRSRLPLRFGTLVVFSDGTDRAHRVSAEAMHQALDEAQFNVFVIALGGEISMSELQRIGRSGVVRATKTGDIERAFTEAAARVENEAKKYYLLSYCSPARAGDHRLRIEVASDGVKGGLEHSFSARAFAPGCDPRARPSFPMDGCNRRPVQP